MSRACHALSRRTKHRDTRDPSFESGDLTLEGRDRLEKCPDKFLDVEVTYIERASDAEVPIEESSKLWTSTEDSRVVLAHAKYPDLVVAAPMYARPCFASAEDAVVCCCFAEYPIATLADACNAIAASLSIEAKYSTLSR
jgi:hypothetical protein